MSRQLALLIAAVVGATAGITANFLASDQRWLAAVIKYGSDPVGQIFLRLLFMLVIPLLFSALVMGVVELDLKQLRRVGGRMLGYTIAVSSIAVVIGLVLVNVIAPGEGLPPEVIELGRENYQRDAPKAPEGGAAQFVINMVPKNIIAAAASEEMFISVIVFALIFGVGLAFTRTPAAERLKELIQGLYDVMMTLINGVLALAPIGVGALVFTMTARLGLSVVANIAVYVVTVLLGLALMLVVYGVSVRVWGKRSPLAFYRDCRLAMITAFSTASSNATLTTALKVADENLRLPRRVSRFVLTAGSAMNQNGTALFEGVTVVFLAQLFGIELGLQSQLAVMGICILGGIGTAGVPSGSIPVVAMILGMFGIPPEGLGLVLGVNHFLDMSRTVINVTGDLAAAVFVSRGADDVSAGETAMASD